MEWTPARIRLLRDVGLCESQHDFAKTLGVAKRTIGNAERGTHPPSLALRRALDQALEHATDTQRNRFFGALATQDAAQDTVQATMTSPGDSRGDRNGSAVLLAYPARALAGLRSAVLGTPPAVTSIPLDVNGLLNRSVGSEMATAMAATVQVHRLYQMADYDAAAKLLPAVLIGLQSSANVSSGHDESLVGTLTARHATAAAYLAAAKLATKLGDVVVASVTADRAMAAAKESGHPALLGAAIYQVACALLLTGELAAAEQIVAVGAENVASVAATQHLSCRQEEVLAVRGSLLLLLAIIAARRADHHAVQKALHDAGRLAEQLGCDSNWLWTAFGPTNVAIHELSCQSRLGNTRLARQLGETINTDCLPAMLRGRRSQVHLELGWVAAEHGDDAVAVLHLLEAERVAEQAVSRNKSAITLLGILLARERKSVTPGLRRLAGRAGLLP